MRTPMLCALALLCGTSFAHAQPYPAYSFAGGQATPAGYPQAAQGYPYQVYQNQVYQNQVYQNPPAYYQYQAPASYVPQSVDASAQDTPPPDGQTVVPAQAPVYPADPSVVDEEGNDYQDVNVAAGSTRPRRWWASLSYSFIFFSPQRISTPLVTMGAPGDANPGALGQPGTVVLFGDKVDFGQFSGIRPNVGIFLDSASTLSLDWEGLFVIPNHVSYLAASDSSGNPIITRPIFNVLTNQERAFLSSSPNIASGNTQVEARSEMFGSEINARYHFQPRQGMLADTLLGFRFLRLSEQLSISDRLTPLATNLLQFERVLVNAPNTLADNDSFRTTNRFYGLQLGGRMSFERDWFSFGGFAKVGLGATDQAVDINGTSTLITPAGTPQVAGGGILALPSNIGHQTRTVVGFVPEAGLNLGVKATCNVDFLIGYSFLYWNQVVRPGAQIDRFVNPNFVPTDASFGPGTGPLRPTFRFNEDTFWMHSINVGMNVHY